MIETLIMAHHLCETYLEWYKKQKSYGLGNLDNKKTYI